MNGGPTPTMAPALASPAVDQGSASGLATDQRGALRPVDFPSIPNSSAPGADGSDIGAVEIQPSTSFALGRLTKNKKKGTATLEVSLGQPSLGTLTLTGKGLKAQSVAVAGQSLLTLKISAGTKKVRKALRKKGKRKIQIDVTYSPLASPASTLSLATKLVRKKHKKKHRSKHAKH